ncbi:hypothetical protein DF186_21575, partial [Enterococcus hirae]
DLIVDLDAGEVPLVDADAVAGEGLDAPLVLPHQRAGGGRVPARGEHGIGSGAERRGAPQDPVRGAQPDGERGGTVEVVDESP